MLARQVATGLYNVTTAVAMAWEAGRTGSSRRMHLAQLVLRQRVLPQDPLGAGDTEPAWLPALFDHAATTGGEPVESINLF